MLTKLNENIKTYFQIEIKQLNIEVINRATLAKLKEYLIKNLGYKRLKNTYSLNHSDSKQYFHIIVNDANSYPEDYKDKFKKKINSLESPSFEVNKSIEITQIQNTKEQSTILNTESDKKPNVIFSQSEETDTIHLKEIKEIQTNQTENVLTLTEGLKSSMTAIIQMKPIQLINKAGKILKN